MLLVAYNFVFLSSETLLLTAQVSIYSGADVVRPWSAMVIGITAGFCMLFTKWFVPRVKVDDPLDATAGIVFK